MQFAFLFVTAALQLLVFFVHWLLYESIKIFGGFGSPLLAWVIVLLSMSFLPASALVHSVNNSFSRWMYRVAATWMGMLVYLFSAVLCTAFLFWISNLFGFAVPAAFILYTLFFVALLVSFHGMSRATRPVVRGIRVKLPHLRNEWAGEKIVFLSDTHLGQIHGTAYARTVATLIEVEKPVAVLFGGDLFDGVACDTHEYAAEFAKIKTKFGIFFVSGNHESYGDETGYFRALNDAGIRILKNEIVNLDGLQIVGIEYATGEDENKYKAALSKLQIQTDVPSILMKHAPTLIATTEESGVNLFLAGHTHHGQQYPFSYLTRWVYRGFDYGLKQYKNLTVYTTSGAGTWGPPIRFMTQSEIVVIEFEK